jgi:hypothetical protein
MPAAKLSTQRVKILYFDSFEPSRRSIDRFQRLTATQCACVSHVDASLEPTQNWATSNTVFYSQTRYIVFTIMPNSTRATIQSDGTCMWWTGCVEDLSRCGTVWVSNQLHVTKLGTVFDRKWHHANLRCFAWLTLAWHSVWFQSRERIVLTQAHTAGVTKVFVSINDCNGMYFELGSAYTCSCCGKPSLMSELQCKAGLIFRQGVLHPNKCPEDAVVRLILDGYLCWSAYTRVAHTFWLWLTSEVELQSNFWADANKTAENYWDHACLHISISVL